MHTKGTTKITISMLAIDHRHGRDISVFGNGEAAKEALYEYVAEWWTREMDEGAPLPENQDDAIMDYFERSQESWSIDEFDVEGAQWAAEQAETLIAKLAG